MLLLRLCRRKRRHEDRTLPHAHHLFKTDILRVDVTAHRRGVLCARFVPRMAGGRLPRRAVFGEMFQRTTPLQGMEGVEAGDHSASSPTGCARQHRRPADGLEGCWPGPTLANGKATLWRRQVHESDTRRRAFHTTAARGVGEGDYGGEGEGGG